MNDQDEDVCFEIMRQKKLGNDELAKEYATYETRRQARLRGDWTAASITTQCHQSIGVKVPFSRTVDRDPNPRIPLSVPSELPTGWLVWWFIVAASITLILSMWWPR